MGRFSDTADEAKREADAKAAAKQASLERERRERADLRLSQIADLKRMVLPIFEEAVADLKGQGIPVGIADNWEPGPAPVRDPHLTLFVGEMVGTSTRPQCLGGTVVVTCSGQSLSVVSKPYLASPTNHSGATAKAVEAAVHSAIKAYFARPTVR
jgi:hypothetical protein